MTEAAQKRLPETDSEENRFGAPPEGLPHLEHDAPSRRARDHDVEVRIIDFSNKKDRAAFIDMAPPLYQGDENYVAPLRMHLMGFLDPKKNPTFKNLTVLPLLAYKNGRVVGRATFHVDAAYNKFHETDAGFFGFFESENDPSIAHALFHDGLAWLKQQGAQEVFGPMNFTTNHQAGTLVENFDRPPAVETTYNPRYYPELIEAFGFGKAKDLLCWWINIEEGTDNKKVGRIARIAAKIKKRESITIRPIDLKNLEEELERVFTIYTAAWEKNWGFVPMSREEFDFLALDLKSVALAPLIMFVEVKGRPVGFTASLPDINEVMPRNGRLLPFNWLKLLFGLKKRKHARLYTLGVIPEYRKRGLESLMFVETVVQAKAQGMVGGEIGWTLEDNDLINRAIESMDGREDRRYRVYGMNL